MVLATDRTTNTSFSSEAPASGESSAYRETVLRAIEDALTKARIDAEAVDQPLLAYFLDMAILEVKNCGNSDQRDPRQRGQKRAADVIQLVS